VSNPDATYGTTAPVVKPVVLRVNPTATPSLTLAALLDSE
jgi:hypothetical protein